MQALLSRFTHHSSNLQPSKIAWELVSFPRRRPYRGTTGPKSPAPLRSRAAGGVGVGGVGAERQAWRVAKVNAECHPLAVGQQGSGVFHSLRRAAGVRLL